MRRAVRVAFVAVAVVVLLLVLVGVEVVIAGNGPHVTEFDPHLADGLFPGLASKDPSVRALRIVWLGDSTAAGVGASGPQHAVSSQVAARLGRPVQLEVRAISGARVADVVARQLADFPADTDLVVVSVGANDVTHLTSAGSFGEDYRTVMAALPSSAGVVLLGVPDIGSATRLAQPLRWIAGTRGQMYDGVVRDVARERDAAYVNVARTTGPSFRSDPDRYFALDHYHPNDDGYRVWADAIAPVVLWELGVHEHPDQPRPPIPQEST